MNKIIGLVTGWGVESWIEPCIKQALEFCDEVLVAIGTKSPVMQRFEDSTLELSKKYRDRVKLLSINVNTELTSVGTAGMLNSMLRFSDLFEIGNWIWILDSDEFYHKRTCDFIKLAIAKDVATHITVKSKFFLVDMYHYLEGEHERLFKITDYNDNKDPSTLFIPTQHWPLAKNAIIKKLTLPKEYPMFHYSMLKNPCMRVFEWEYEQPNTKQERKVKWAHEIYKYYDLDNEEYWINKNLEVSGIRHPWFHESYNTDENGKLFVYKGKQPKYIEETELPKIKDFRAYYSFT
jgi:hypothetical protein